MKTVRKKNLLVRPTSEILYSLQGKKNAIFVQRTYKLFTLQIYGHTQSPKARWCSEFLKPITVIHINNSYFFHMHMFQSANLEFPLRRYGLHLQTACWCNYLGAHLRYRVWLQEKLPSFSSSVSVVFPPKLVSLFQHLSFCFTNPFCWQICALLFIPSQLYACRAISTYLFTFILMI